MDRYIYIFEDGTTKLSYNMTEEDWESIEAGVLDVIKVYPDNSDPEIAVSDGSVYREFMAMNVL